MHLAGDRHTPEIIARLPHRRQNFAAHDSLDNRQFMGKVVIEPAAAQIQPVGPAKGHELGPVVVGDTFHFVDCTQHALLHQLTGIEGLWLIAIAGGIRGLEAIGLCDLVKLARVRGGER